MGREANQTELHALLSSCLQCHHIGATNPNHPAPSLSGLFDRKIEWIQSINTIAVPLNSMIHIGQKIS